MAKGFFRGIFTGGLVGFVLGILFAPQKGEETRRQLSKVSEDLTSKVKDVSEKIRRKREELAEKIRGREEEF